MPHQITIQVPAAAASHLPPQVPLRCLSANSLGLSTSQYVSQTLRNGTYWDVAEHPLWV
jgi:hypothetical protein